MNHTTHRMPGARCASVPAALLTLAGAAYAADLSQYTAREIPQTESFGLSVIRLTESGLIGGSRIVETETGAAMLPFVGTPGGSLDAMNQLNFSQAWAEAINDSGAIAGFGQFRHADGTVTGTLFRYVPGEGMSNIGLFDGPGGGVADINDRGETVGYALVVDGPMNLGHAFYHSPATGIVDLGTFGGYQSYAYDVNNNGLVVGMANLPNSIYGAFAWRDGVMTNLGSLGGNHSTAYFANDDNQVFGVSETAHSGDRWFIWSDETGMREFRPRPGTLVQRVFQTNSRGDLAGYYNDEAGLVTLFTYAAETGFTDLRTINQLGIGNVRDVNGRGEAVSLVQGDSWQSNPTFFAPGEAPQRIDLIDFGFDWTVFSVHSLTESGQFLVSGVDEAANEHFAVLTPPAACPGDLDGDHAVGLSDLATLLGAFGCEGSACAGNLDGDTDTDLTDLATLLSVFGTACE